MTTPRLSVAAAAGALVFSSAAPAEAQSRTGFAIDRFEPAERGSQLFVSDTLDLRGNLRPALGAVLDYAYKPLVVYDLDGAERGSVVRHQLFAHLGGSLVLASRLRLGLNLPVALYQDGESTPIAGEPLVPADRPAIGDLRLAADVRVVGDKTDPFTLAVGVRGWLPTGVRSQFTGDGSARFAPQVLAAGDLGFWTYSARLAVVYRARDDVYAGSELGSELFGAAGVGIKSADARLVIGPEVFGGTVFTGSDTFFERPSSPVDWLFGMHYDVAEDVRVGAGVGGGLTRGYGSPQLRGVLSLEWAPSFGPRPAGPDEPSPPSRPPPDADKDGIGDPEDACPTVPGYLTSDPATNGCPDRDVDGIPDGQDACPDAKGGASADPAKNGCPPPEPEPAPEPPAPEPPAPEP